MVSTCDKTAKFWDEKLSRRVRSRRDAEMGRRGDGEIRRRRILPVSRPTSLNIIPDCALEICSVVSAQGKLLAVFHDDAVFTVKPGLHLFDLVDLDNR